MQKNKINHQQTIADGYLMHFLKWHPSFVLRGKDCLSACNRSLLKHYQLMHTDNKRLVPFVQILHEPVQMAICIHCSKK